MTWEWQSQLWTLAAVALAMVLGGAVGFERELKRRPAGFRTHMLVAGAAALLIGIARMAVHDPVFRDLGYLRMDPLRMVEAVIAGVGFIGAGTIFAVRRGEGVAGITTAASLLLVAVIGVAAGFDYFVLAVATTLLTLIVLALLHAVERRAHQSAGDARK